MLIVYFVYREESIETEAASLKRSHDEEDEIDQITKKSKQEEDDADIISDIK